MNLMYDRMDSPIHTVKSRTKRREEAFLTILVIISTAIHILLYYLFNKVQPFYFQVFFVISLQCR